MSRARLILQMTVEGVTLSAFGIVGALVITVAASQVVRRWLIGEGAFTGAILDWPVLLFTIAVGMVTGIAASLLPALQTGRTDLASALKTGSRLDSARASRTRDALLMVQGAVAVVLLAGAMMFIRSLQNAETLDVGLDVDRILMARVDQGTTGLTPAETRSMFDQFVRRAEGVPGIRAAALTSPIPFGGSWSTSIYVPGRTLPPTFPNVFQYFVTPGYFAVAGIRIVRGRALSDADNPQTAILVNETLGRLLWPRENPVGRCLKLDADTMPCATIVGIVTDTHRQDLDEDAVAQVYRRMPMASADRAEGTFFFMGYTLVARTDGPASRYVGSLHRALQSTGSTVPYTHVQTMRDLMGRHTRNWELGAKAFSAFGVLALLLAAVGLFSVVAFTVAQRMYEFGVRMALGATPAHLARITLVRGLVPALGGIVLGIVLVLSLGRFLDGLLFHASANDPVAFGTATGVLLVCAVIASLVPAVRASHADPKVALTSE